MHHVANHVPDQMFHSVTPQPCPIACHKLHPMHPNWPNSLLLLLLGMLGLAGLRGGDVR